MKVSDVLCQSVDDFDQFVLDQKRITFKQYQSDVARYCAAFKKLSAQSVVLYISDNLYLFFCCFMGLLHAGKDIILPVYVTQKTIEDMFAYTPAVVTNQPFETTGNLIYPDKIVTEEKSDLIPIQNRTVSFFTSGSTGKPKLINKNFEMLASEVQMHSEMQRAVIEKNPVLIATVLPNHMFGMLWRFLFSLANHLLQDLDTVISPEEIQDKQNRYENILLVTTPTFMNEIAAYSEQYQFKKNCLAIYSAGSLLTAKTAQKMLDLFDVSPFEVFASTETGGVAYRNQTTGEKWHVFDAVKMEQNDQQCLRVVSSPFSFVCPFDMQDVIQDVTQNTFILLGRNDRIVKIAESRVDLNEMEEKLMAFPFIREVRLTTYTTDKNFLALAAIICLNSKGTAFLKTADKISLVQKIKKHLSAYYEKSILPKKFRFVHQIPKNPQGKILKKDISEILASSAPEPIVENLKVDENSLSADLTFLKDAIYFQGHFPGHPILPGVIQLHFAFYFLKRYFNEYEDNYTLHKLKFTSLILPDKTVHFELTKTGKKEFDFLYSAPNKNYSSGKIRMGEVANV
ncbi:MAG: AMP-binding protein [Alphaproteobacteria bacterium]|nr:AMP-binding protein [Alphaproteobacteria bacterium]